MTGVKVKKIPGEVWGLIALSLVSVAYYCILGSEISSRVTPKSGQGDLGFGSGIAGIGNSVTGIAYLVTGFFQLLLAVYLYKGSRGWWISNTVFLYLSVVLSFSSGGNIYLLIGEIVACVLSVMPSTRRYFSKTARSEVAVVDAEQIAKMRKRRVLLSVISSVVMMLAALAAWHYMISPALDSIKASYGGVVGL